MLNNEDIRRIEASYNNMHQKDCMNPYERQALGCGCVTVLAALLYGGYVGYQYVQPADIGMLEKSLLTPAIVGAIPGLLAGYVVGAGFMRCLFDDYPMKITGAIGSVCGGAFSGAIYYSIACVGAVIGETIAK